MQKSFFDINVDTYMEGNAPLADRMRPRTLEEFLGQSHIISKGKLLYRMIEADKLTSVIFYGPPGSGKTSLAKVIAMHTKANFYELNAVASGKKDIEEIITKAQVNLGAYQKKTILFIDEIHRFNKVQQDALLPSVEQGIVVLIGATTENPYFEINAPLLSRSTIFEFKKLTEANIEELLDMAVADRERGFGLLKIQLDKDAKKHWAQVANGDVRRAFNALELAVLTVDKNNNGSICIDVATASECIQKKSLNYDKDGDNHYDTISAFIKSIRGSDPQAALFWLAKMLEAGEDPKFIARRIIISASEDIGNAEPMGIVVAIAAARAVEMIGLPEARINLAQAVTFLASSPKSNSSYVGIKEAENAVKKKSNAEVPVHLKDTSYSQSEKLGRGVHYKYPHNYPNHYAPQQYLPTDIFDAQFYKPANMGYEKKISQYLNYIKKFDEESRGKDE